MSYPPHGGYPDDGYGQQPQYPNYGGYPQQPTSGYPAQDPNAGYPDPNMGYQQQGYQAWPQQHDPYQAGGVGGPPPPPKKSKLPLIVLSAVAGVLVISVVATLAIVGLKGKDDDGPGTDTASGSSSDSPTEPSPTETEPEEITDLTYVDMQNDWSGSGGTQLDYKGGMDYNKCTTFIADNSLTDQGCESAVELSYEGEDGELKAAVFYIVMAEEKQASDTKSTVGDEQMRPLTRGFIEGADYAQWKSDSYLNVIVLSYVTATDKIEKDTANSYLSEITGGMVEQMKETV